jgi:hypothetical protein
MNLMAKDLNLRSTTVHYCTLGRDDQKPTNLWTNVRASVLVLPFATIISYNISGIPSAYTFFHSSPSTCFSVSYHFL